MTKYSRRLIETLEFYRCTPCENIFPNEKDCFFQTKEGVYFTVPKDIQSWVDANKYLNLLGIRDRLE